MRITAPRLSVSSIPDLVRSINRWAIDVVTQANNLAEGRLIARHNALTAAPTTGSYAVGDFIWNKTPAEAGTALSKYVIIGWVCVTAGSPGTWLECRCLTGN